jgi:hypothetical protein
MHSRGCNKVSTRAVKLSQKRRSKKLSQKRRRKRKRRRKKRRTKRRTKKSRIPMPHAPQPIEAEKKLQQRDEAGSHLNSSPVSQLRK